MRTTIISYSLTGNNERYAKKLAELLGVTHITLKTQKPVTNATIFGDLLFQRKPEIDLPEQALLQYDQILFIAPVWMGQVAFPLRRCFDLLKTQPRPYGFLSISGGALGDNPKLTEELTRRAGAKPAFVLDQHIVSLLPADPPPTSKDTSSYQLSKEVCARISAVALKELQKYFPTAIRA